MKNNIEAQPNDSDLVSLTEVEDAKASGTPTQIPQPSCPDGAHTLEEFRQALYKAVDKMILEKYGSDYIR